MFWSTMAIEEREIDVKLNSENPKLESILNDVHCLQEIRNSNGQLMDFLKQEDNLRKLIMAIITPVDEEADEQLLKSEYRVISQCCEALCVGAREFYPEFEKYPQLLEELAGFLDNNHARLNPLVASFYSRVVVCFLSTEPEKFLDILEKSNFIESCMNGLKFCSLFELLCTFMNCTPDPSIRDRIKRWYVDKGFPQKLLWLLSAEQPSYVHENGAALWVEFIRALREVQYNVEQTFDPLLEAIQSEEIVTKLLSMMFPVDGGKFSASIISNGALVLNVLLETNQIRNSPSSILAQELQGASSVNNNSLLDGYQNCSFNSTDNSTSSTGQILMDPKRIVETRCAEYASSIISLILYGLDPVRNPKIYIRHNDSNRIIVPADSKESEDVMIDDFCDDFVHNCMQLLINLTNTNFLPTHFELLRAFLIPETSFNSFCEQIEVNPCRSIFNTQFVTFILHILYSNTGTTQQPLIDFLIKDFNLPAFILNALPDSLWGDDFSLSSDNNIYSNKLFSISKRSLFLFLANRLLLSQQNSPVADYIDEMIKESSVYEKWHDFCTSSVQSFIDQNRSEKINSISVSGRTSNFIEVDELPNDNVLTLPNINIDPQITHLIVDEEERRGEALGVDRPSQPSPTNKEIENIGKKVNFWVINC
uniref:Uncharacterized protein n=1 Tax=Meloidogyne enterolobii TaxID=390850 RepID=A0A6V7V419_MELEN|nr:unnamed protein product [Meloidogyne enterolobii]